MTESSIPKRSSLRRVFLLLTGLLIGIVALGVWLFVANFDLDRYREQIVSAISRQLQLPVTIGRARLELREAGIACRFSDVTIGSPQTDRELKARTVWLQLAWRGVLKRQPIFSEIALDEPHLRMRIDTTNPTETVVEPVEPEGDWLDELGIRSIEIHRGTVDLSWQTAADPQLRQFKAYAIDLDIDNLAKGRRLLFSLAGQLRDDASRPERISLRGSLQLLAGRPLTVGDWELDLTAREINVAPLAALLPAGYHVRAGGIADLTAALRGTADTTAAFQARLHGSGLSIRPGTNDPKARPLKELYLAGEWQRTPEGHALRKLAVQLDDAHLTGDLALIEQRQHREVHIDLGAGTLPLATVLPWLPERLRQETAGLRQLYPQGRLAIDTASLQLRLPRDQAHAPEITVRKLSGAAHQLVWILPGGAPLEIVSLPVALADGRWEVTSAEVRLGKIPVLLGGVVTQQDAAPPLVALELQAHGEAAQIAALVTKNVPPELDLGGSIGLQGRLEGPADQLVFDLRLDLEQLQGGYGDTVTLPATAAAAWTASGVLFPDRLQITRSELVLAPLRGTLHGEVGWSEEPSVKLSGELALDDFTNLYRQMPALAKAGLHGGMTVAVDVAGPLAKPGYRGSCTLHGLGLPMHGIIGDISAVRGQLQLDGRRLQGEGVTALLGRSPVTLRINIPDLTNPHLDLKVQAAAVRADELIFRSDARQLRDLTGRLLIDRDSITFAPVHVRLDQGTRATIHGSVKSFTAPKVDLSISGEYANVEEIIALWTDESPAAEAARLARHTASPPAPLPPIRIEVNAKHGDLYGMQFNEARTLIVPTDAHLLLHPLDFKVGDGYCSTQVLLDYTGAHSQLRVSGHVENVDAYQVYNELLDRKSIVRGTLRGDFFLQGELGAPGSRRFLSTSYGNVHFTVRDGVMRHSPLLGTIFSVLNVSQLFQGKLPDVSREGVPFTLMTADMSLDKGLLQNKYLVIESNALDMSYLGQFDLLDNQLDLLVVVKPLGNVDTVVSHLPVAGWILTGEERTFLTAQFKVTGQADNPKVEAIPITTLSKGVLGIIQRTLSLPWKLVTDPAILWGQGGKK